MHTVPRLITVIMPTFSGNIGFPFLSLGTTGILYCLLVTVWAFKRLGFVVRCTSTWGHGALGNGEVVLPLGGGYDVLGPAIGDM
jgi:hypothetical protein